MNYMNRKLVVIYILPMIRTLIEKYLNQFSGDAYEERAFRLYNFMEWLIEQADMEEEKTVVDSE